MVLGTLDWIIVGAYLALSLFIGLRLKNKASGNLSNFFLGGRNLPWYIAGISMVATTFAADTPLWVTEKIAQHGVSGNWLWWNMLIGGMLTTFFFAKLWRRSGVITELELIEIRYSGKAAAFLRGFKSIYMGIFLNAVVIGWVNAAMVKIIMIYFNLPAGEALWYVGGLMVLVAGYSSVSGFLGVAITDMIQFALAIIGCIILAIFVLNSEKVGGMTGLKAQLPAWRFEFFPNIGEQSTSENIGTFSMTLGAFLTCALVQWWASWYPGAEPGGGGYISQRMMSAKNEKHAVMATLFFQIAHYCLRPWPWIIVGLCALVLYPDLSIEDSGNGFVLAMKDYLPAGLKGLLFVSFLAAYMSTISTQLNWGSSYLTNDLYKRFLRPESSFESTEKAQNNYILWARLFTIIIMVFAFIATMMTKSIDGAARFLIECGAGLGVVLILRWYWWRVSAWSEIAASIAPFIGFTLTNFVFDVPAPYNFLFTVAFSTVTWLIVTLITPPTDSDVLEAFQEKVQPNGIWPNKTGGNSTLLPTVICWISSLGLTYSILFLIGKMIFLEWSDALIWLGVGAISFLIFWKSLKKAEIFS